MVAGQFQELLAGGVVVCVWLNVPPVAAPRRRPRPPLLTGGGQGCGKLIWAPGWEVLAAAVRPRAAPCGAGAAQSERRP
jgi:hypothetical protein